MAAGDDDVVVFGRIAWERAETLEVRLPDGRAVAVPLVGDPCGYFVWSPAPGAGTEAVELVGRVRAGRVVVGEPQALSTGREIRRASAVGASG